MAMIKCKECGADVSDAAKTCPSCGVQIRKPKRGAFGQLAKWTFILFNLFMIYAVFSGLVNVGSEYDAGMSEAEQAGFAAGTTVGLGLLLMLWALGDVVLGMLVLFTRPK